MSDLVVVVPARMASTRFPGKPLADLNGRPMIAHVLDRIGEANLGCGVVIATPDAEIAAVAETLRCNGNAVEVAMTRDDHPSGTDRIAEVMASRSESLVINVQGDEPLIAPASISALAKGMKGESHASVGTIWVPAEVHEIDDPSVVKVVTTADHRALYFSRYPIPYPRSVREAPVKRHLGIYAYRKEALSAFAAASPSALETTEGLEQLRYLEIGMPVYCWQGVAGGTSVDTPEQADEVRRQLNV